MLYLICRLYYIMFQLSPLDAGAASGLTFTAPRWETSPPAPVTKHGPRTPNHPAAGFYYPELKELPSIARIEFTKVFFLVKLIFIFPFHIFIFTFNTIIFFYFHFFATATKESTTLSYTIQHAMSRKLDEKQRTSQQQVYPGRFPGGEGSSPDTFKLFTRFLNKQVYLVYPTKSVIYM